MEWLCNTSETSFPQTDKRTTGTKNINPYVLSDIMQKPSHFEHYQLLFHTLSSDIMSDVLAQNVGHVRMSDDFSFTLMSLYKSGFPLHRENRGNGQKRSLSWKAQGIWKCCQNREFVKRQARHREFPDSKGQRFCDICREISSFFLKN